MEALINGVKVPNSLLSELKETNLKNTTDEKLRQTLNDNGYLFLRNVIEKNDITKARNDIFEKLKNVEKKEKQIIFIGRNSYEKGIDILRGIESKIDAKVIYCTDMKWEEAMENLKASSILVVPSRMESIPQVIKEAFYLKIPIIATNVGGIPELITNNETGILIPPNEPKMLESRINKLLLDDETSKKLADSGYEFVMNNLTWEILLPKYIKFYEDLTKILKKEFF